jgi:hypothetical protein
MKYEEVSLKNIPKNYEIDYDTLFSKVREKANYLIDLNPTGYNLNTTSLIIRNSIANSYSIPEYESTMELVRHIKDEDNVLILASWLSLMRLEIFNLMGKIKKIILLDHDKSVITLGQTISTMYPNMDIQYIRKNVVFNDISEYFTERQIIIVPSINQLLPFDELLPNLPKNTLISVHGTSNMKMRYGNPIYNPDDLKSQISCQETFLAKRYDSKWSTNQGTYKFVTSVIVARI